MRLVRTAGRADRTRALCTDLHLRTHLPFAPVGTRRT
jgi:hypothetical protein